MVCVCVHTQSLDTIWWNLTSFNTLVLSILGEPLYFLYKGNAHIVWDALTSSNIASSKNLEFSEHPPPKKSSCPYRVLVFPISGRIFAQVQGSHPKEYLACTLTQTSTFHIGDMHRGNSALKEGERTIEEPH